MNKWNFERKVEISETPEAAAGRVLPGTGNEISHFTALPV